MVSDPHRSIQKARVVAGLFYTSAPPLHDLARRDARG